MKTVPIQSLSQLQPDVRQLQVFPEEWFGGGEYSRYRNSPRPSSGFFIVCTNVQAVFSQKDREPVVAGKGDVVYIPKGVHYHAEVWGGGEQIDTYTVNFQLRDESGEEILFGDHICILASRSDEQLALSAAALSSAVHRAEQPNHLKVKASVYHLLDLISTSAQECSQVYYPIRVGVEALRAQWNKNRPIEEYARICGMGTAYFYRCFKTWCGKTPVQYRNDIRLSTAEMLLRCSDRQVGEVAKMIGFDDPFYFSRIFHKAYGISPKEYRQLMEEKYDYRSS